MIGLGQKRCIGLLWILILAWPMETWAVDTLMPSIVHEGCVEFSPGQSFVIWARFEDESQLFDPKVIYRTGPNRPWTPIPLIKEPGTEDFKAVIPAHELGKTLEYFIEVFDEFGNGPARMGSPDAPLRVMASASPAPCQQIPLQSSLVTVDSRSVQGGGFPGLVLPTQGTQVQKPVGRCQQKDRPLYCEQWLWWTVSGVVLTGGALGTYFAVKQSQKKGPKGIDSVILSVTVPDPTKSP